jgi:WD40 repeat protein
MRGLYVFAQLSCLGFAVAANAAAPAQDPPVSYNSAVSDILLAKCVGCHNRADLKGKLSLEDVAGILKGGRRGPALVPGDANGSRLFLFAAHREKPFMPPIDRPEAERLSPKELALLKAWIEQGARDDSESETAHAPSIGTLPRGFAPINAVDLTDDGKRLTAGRGNLVEVYDADTGILMHVLAGPHRDVIQSLRFSPDGRYIAGGSYQVVSVWTCPSLTELQNFAGHSAAIRASVVTRNAKNLITTGADKTLRFWNLATSSIERVVSLPAEGSALAIGSNDERVAVGCADGAIRVFDGDRPRAVLYGHVGVINALEFLYNDIIISVSDDGTLRLWRLPRALEFAAEAPQVFDPSAGAVLAALVLNNEKNVATAGADGVIRLWNLNAGELLAEIPVSAGAKPLALTALEFGGPSGLLWAGVFDGRIVAIDLTRRCVVQTLSAHQGAIKGLSISPEGGRLASVDDRGAVVCWDLRAGEPLMAFAHSSPKRGDPLKGATSVRLLSDESLITTSESGTAKRWGIEGHWADWLTLPNHEDRVLALDFHPDGTLLAVGSGEPTRGGQLTIWETGKGLLVRRIGQAHSDSVYGVRFSPNGAKLASASADKLLKVFEVASGRELHSMEGHTSQVLAVDWSADGKQLVSGGADDLLKFWDAETGESLRTSQPVGKQFTSLRWPRGPGGPLVATASGDREVRFWNPSNAQVTRTFQGPDDFVYSVALSADRTRVAAGGAEGILFVWNGANAQLLHKIGPRPNPVAPNPDEARLLDEHPAGE